MVAKRRIFSRLEGQHLPGMISRVDRGPTIWFDRPVPKSPLQRGRRRSNEQRSAIAARLIWSVCLERGLLPIRRFITRSAGLPTRPTVKGGQRRCLAEFWRVPRSIQRAGIQYGYVDLQSPERLVRCESRGRSPGNPSAPACSAKPVRRNLRLEPWNLLHRASRSCGRRASPGLKLLRLRS